MIYEPHQFEVVSNGMIDKVVFSDDTINAVRRVLSGEERVNGDVLFFATPACDFSAWAEAVETIQGHTFWKAK